ncbi:MAG: BREX-1 system adenine-specific DNA-methyltransferase PglX [Mobilitalea sp.]
MDRNAIRKYAVWARTELISRVSQKALQYGIDKNGYGEYKTESVNGIVLSEIEKKQRQALISQIRENGYSQIIEEVAYTWFNRFAALRFMEVNGYLPSHVRVFTDEENLFKPQILTEAIHIELEGLNKERVYELKNCNKDDELFKYLIILQCNALSNVLPGMFQTIDDFTELLFPDNLLREGSVIHIMIEEIAENDWKDAVEIIGWLYQYYISEPKDALISARNKYKTEDIPYVTQLFTTDWIVRFIVENSLGKLWLDSNPNDVVKEKWAYLLESNTRKLNESTEKKSPEDIKCIDPCMGSGHILVYLFDVLIQIYESYGYSTRDAVESIVRNNLYGLDIDERAAQLAYFAIMMKATQYDRRFLSRGIQPKVYVFTDSKKIDINCIDYFTGNDEKLRSDLEYIVLQFNDSKEIGSAIRIENIDFEKIHVRIREIKKEINFQKDIVIKEVLPILNIAEILAGKYSIVVTNPPYMNASYMPVLLKEYIQKEYYDFRSDLFAVFTKRTLEMCNENGYVGLLMPYVWMFISSYEEMRKWINQNANIMALVQLEYNAFEAACVPVATLTLKKTSKRESGECVKLSQFRGAENQGPKTLEAIKNPYCNYRYTATQDDYEKLPGSIFAFWAQKRIIETFTEAQLGKILTTREGMATAGNEDFLRLWHEVSFDKIGWNIASSEEAMECNKKWYPYNKGGEYRKWYGNNDYVVNWGNDGSLIRNNRDPKTGRIRSHNYNGQYGFKEGITWSALSSSNISVRYCNTGFLFDSKGAKGFATNENDLLYSLALINSKVGLEYLSFISPTIDFKVGDVIQIPYIYEETKGLQVIQLVKKSISISKTDWNSFEISWDFKKHPLLRENSIKKAFNEWEKECTNRIDEIINAETEINKLLIEIYRLEDEVDAEVKREDIVLSEANLRRDIKSLISYAVGCMFGRYSLIHEGIQVEEQSDSELVDVDNIIPISDDEYFNDDVLSKFVKFIEIAYGAEYLEDNLKYIAEALGGKGRPKEVIRNYFISDFYSDHCNFYAVMGAGKRPIYWLFDSGKKNGFKALVYIHRYQQDTLARMRTDYVHELQARYRTIIEDIEKNVATCSTSERVKLTKQLNYVKAQNVEITDYEEKIHHLADQMIKIDLDDGFKTNYARFEDVVAKIK